MSTSLVAFSAPDPTSGVIYYKDSPLLPRYLPRLDKTGEIGKFRTILEPGRVCPIEANTDYEAAAAFLRRFENSPNTFINYRKELNRYMGWMSAQGLSLTDVTGADAQNYENYLQMPPACDVTEPNKTGGKAPRLSIEHPDYRPFAGPLSPVSRRQAYKVLNSFYVFLQSQMFCDYNPFSLLLTRLPRQRADLQRQNAKDRVIAKSGTDRCISISILDMVISRLREDLNETPDNPERVRQIWVLKLLYYTGARRQEIAQGFMGDFSLTGLGEKDPKWNLYVEGKGQKAREIPVVAELVRALVEYRNFYNLPDYPITADDKTRPLVLSLSGVQRVGPRTIYQIVVDAFDWFSRRIEEDYPPGGMPAEALALKDKVAQFSTHWLRHSFVTSLVQNGTPIANAALIVDHANPQTTMMYLQNDQNMNRTYVESNLDRLKD